MPAAAPPLAVLLAAKGHSDRRQYAAKHALLRRLMLDRPGEFAVDSDDGRGILGLTHLPTRFRVHAPAAVVPAGVARLPADEPGPVGGATKAATDDVPGSRHLARYECPHCGGRAYTGTPGTNTRFRGSAHCVDCGKGMAAIARRDLLRRPAEPDAPEPGTEAPEPSAKTAGLASLAVALATKSTAALANVMARNGLIAPEDRVHASRGALVGIPLSLAAGYAASRYASRQMAGSRPYTETQRAAILRHSGADPATPVLLDPDDPDAAHFDPGTPDGKGQVVLGKNMRTPATLSHELGHASIHQGGGLSRFNQSHLRGLDFIPSLVAASTVGPAAGVRWGPLAGIGAGAAAGVVAGLPTLINERQATSRAHATLQAAGLPAADRERARRDLRGAFATYLTGAAAPAALGGLAAAGFKRYMGKRADARVPLNPGVELQDNQRRAVDAVQAGQRALLLYQGLGSGKGLAGLAAAASAGDPITAVVPAALRENIRKDRRLFLAPDAPDLAVMSHTALGQGQGPTNPDSLVVDEAQRFRNYDSKQTQGLLAAADRAKRVLLLSGTPVVNGPADFAPMYQILTGRPTTPAEFARRFVRPAAKPGLVARLFGRPGRPPELRNVSALKRDLAGKVVYHGPPASGVRVDEEDVPVTLSREQADLYRGMYGRIPRAVRARLEQNDLTPADLRKLQNFLAGPRMVGLSAYPITGGDPSAAAAASGKLSTALGRLTDRLAADPKAKALVFANFIDAGLVPYQAALKARGVDAGLFSGAMSDADRKKLVDDYNADRLRVALVGPAGTEGLSFKGTRLVQLLDPHFHGVRGRQSVGRAVRFDSHKHLPEADRQVTVERYLGRLPAGGLAGRLGLAGPKPAVDDFLRGVEGRKDDLNRQLLDVLREVGSAKTGAVLDRLAAGIRER